MIKNTISKKLYRSESDKMIAGIAGGVGEYFQIDPSIVRIIFLLLTFFYGIAIPLYILMWIIIPKKTSLKKESAEYIKENTQEISDQSKKFTQNMHIDKESSSNHVAIIIIFIGILFLARNFGFFDWLDIGKFWPLLLVAFGIMQLIKR